MFSLERLFVNVSNNGYLEMGHLASLGSKSVIATNKIILELGHELDQIPK